MEDLTPMMKQYHEVKRRFPGKMVFFRLGDFYEMFYEDAVVASRELEITLTARNKDKAGAPSRCAGCPITPSTGISPGFLERATGLPFASRWKTPRLPGNWFTEKSLAYSPPGL